MIKTFLVYAKDWLTY